MKFWLYSNITQCTPTAKYNSIICNKGVWKTENWFGFGFKRTELSKNLTSVQTVFRQKLCTVRNWFKLKVTKK